MFCLYVQSKDMAGGWIGKTEIQTDVDLTDLSGHLLSTLRFSTVIHFLTHLFLSGSANPSMWLVGGRETL